MSFDVDTAVSNSFLASICHPVLLIYPLVVSTSIMAFRCTKHPLSCCYLNYGIPVHKASHVREDDRNMINNRVFRVKSTNMRLMKPLSKSAPNCVFLVGKKNTVRSFFCDQATFYLIDTCVNLYCY